MRAFARSARQSRSRKRIGVAAEMTSQATLTVEAIRNLNRGVHLLDRFLQSRPILVASLAPLGDEAM
jgi:hypothetical protein